MPYYPHPLAFEQGFDDVGTHRNAANLFDLAAGYRLTVGNQGERLHERSRVAGGTFLPEPPYPSSQILTHLKAIPRGHLHQLVTPILVTLFHRLDRRANLFLGGALVLLE